ncbi:TetR/AcrR family transcriptional regulator [Kribbella albertanoniae]|uniref:TetR/AcrR family transcriptional regulator n=1 Tax=Kribbella albertanoniae TaxID=1266829 RepID=A0A4R4PSV8_9ACTN|nr:TetR/AcrR family transcriptional regulator [Kribbella albertanoniae]TDC25450.1 TetR/AcrR family transcriptional regulator [Kribbella albertanoniae]
MTDGAQNRRVRVDGVRSRRMILDTAVKLATVDGLAGLSIARLAEAAGISKSGLFAHFGSKEDLQLATIDAATEIYGRDIVGPAMQEPDSSARLRALCNLFLDQVENDVFPGGCFFSSVNSEFDTRPGIVRDRLAELQTQWMELLAAEYAAARDAGLLPDEEPEQAAFDLNSYLHLANDLYVLYRDRSYLDRARRSIAAYLATA